MAAIQTTLTLKDDISKRLKVIEKRVRSLAKTMDNFNKGFVKSGKSAEQTATKINKLTTATKKLGTSTKNVERLNKSLRQTGFDASSARTGVDGLTRSVRRLATAYLGMVGIGKVLDTADSITGATNKLSTIYKMQNSGASAEQTKAAVQGQMDDIYASAQRSRASYTDAIHNVGKMLINAQSAFGGNIDKAIAFNELMSKSYTIGGASDKEQSSSMYQLIQALGSGNLAGDELRSVREGAQVAYKYIEEHAQLVLNSQKSLKDLAAEGLVTSTIVTDAILKNAEAINSMFDDTQVTFEQTWTKMKNDFVKAFEPVLQKLTTLLNNKEFQEMLTGMTNAFVGFANATLDALEWIANAWKTVNNWVRENANLISSVLIPVLAALAVAWIVMGVASLIANMIAYWWIYLIIGAIILVIAAMMEWAWVAEFVGGFIGMAIAVVWNLIVMLVNFIYDIVVTVYNFIANIVNTFLNMFSGGWQDFLMGAARLLWNFVEVVYDALQAVARVFDAVFGTGIADGMQTVQDQINGFLNKADSNEVVYIKPLEQKALLERMEYGNAVEKGASIGKGAHEWLNNTKDKLTKGISGGSAENTLGGLGNNWETTIGNALDNSDTGGNIGGIADAIELTKEDLAYLRELAEMEAINRFTTAEIKVDMTNNNTINGENDLDGLFTKMSEKLEEEMHIVADGTY